MDANKMVQYAKNWTSAPEQVTCEVYLKTSGLVVKSSFPSITTKSFYILRALFD